MKRRSLTRRLRDAKAENARLNAQLMAVTDDRDKMRDYFAATFRRFVDMLAAGNNVDLKWMIKDMCRQAGEQQGWWWR